MAGIDLTVWPRQPLRLTDPRLVSYNIEMAEVTGGTFWKPYTPEQKAGTEPFAFEGDLSGGFTELAGLMQHYPPIDLYDETLRARARALGPAWVRVSGTWATRTYYDLEDRTGGVIPDGYAAVLTRAQWVGVLDFVRAVGARLMVSVSNCAGDHPKGGPLDLAQAKKLFRFSADYGVEIGAAEFMNEPDMLAMSGAPAGYTPEDYRRDQDRFFAWLRQAHPDCLAVGPCTVGGGLGLDGIPEAVALNSAEELLEGLREPLDVFSYHHYTGVSQRLAGLLPELHWDRSMAVSREYLAAAPDAVRTHAALRDRYLPGAPLWVTESGDAAAGGSTWASTWLDVPRTLNELGSFCTLSEGVIFHNTLCASDYGWLDRETHQPRPNYWAVLLWNKLMGRTVYQAPEGRFPLYCHSRKDGEKGRAWLVINTSLLDPLQVRLPREAQAYILSAPSPLSGTVLLNGSPLGGAGDLKPVILSSGSASVPPLGCGFFIV